MKIGEKPATAKDRRVEALHLIRLFGERLGLGLGSG